MVRIAPSPLASDKLVKAWTPWIAPGAACPYFEADSTVKVGPYQGHLRYIRWPPTAGIGLRDAVLSNLFSPPHDGPDAADHGRPLLIQAVATVETPRGLLRMLIDRLFHGIAFDGTVMVRGRQLAAFLHLEQSMKRLRTGGKDENLAGKFDIHGAPERAMAALRDRLRLIDPANWPAVEELLTVPEVAEAVWHDRTLLRCLLDRCPTHHEALYRLAEICDPGRPGPATGLKRLLDDSELMDRYVIPLLHDAIEKLCFVEATDALAPFRGLRTRTNAQLFWREGGKVPRDNASLWAELLHKAVTLDQLVDLASFHPDVRYARYIEDALKHLSARRVAEYIDAVEHIVSSTLEGAEANAADAGGGSPRIDGLRRLVEQSLPAFLAGPHARRERTPLVPADAWRLAILARGTHIPRLLDRARQRFGDAIQFDVLIACTPGWRWSAAPTSP